MPCAQLSYRVFVTVMATDSLRPFAYLVSSTVSPTWADPISGIQNDAVGNGHTVESDDHVAVVNPGQLCGARPF